MIKYLPIENATIELNFSNKEEYVNFINQRIVEIEKHGFKRIIINTSEDDYIYIYDSINSIIDDAMLVIFQASLTKDTDIDLKDNFIFYNKTNKIIKHKNIYNIISSQEKNKVIKMINDNVNVVIDPIININEIAAFDNDIQTIIKNVNTNDIYLGGYVLPTFLMKEHPCNSYLCHGHNCHKKMTGLPREIFVDKDYNVYPHKLKYQKLKMGNINDISFEELFINYLRSKEYDIFVKYNRKIFINILRNYPYEYMPIVDYLKAEVESDE